MGHNEFEATQQTHNILLRILTTNPPSRIMGASSRIVLLIGLIFVIVASYVGYVHTMKPGSTTLPAAVEELLERIVPTKKKVEMTEVKPVNERTEVKEAAERKSAFDLHQTITNLQIPCGFIIATSLYKQDPSALLTAPVTPLDTILDPTLRQSTITKDAVLADRYLKILYEESRHERYISAEALWLRMGSLEATVPSPQLLVIDDDGSKYKLRLGRDFMQAHNGKIDLDEMELYISIGGIEKVMVPFLQTRAALESMSDEL